MNLLSNFLPIVLTVMTVTGRSKSLRDVFEVLAPQSAWSIVRKVEDDTTTKTASDTATPPILGSSIRYGMDTTVSPCVDFYQYVNGGWRSRTVLPPSTRQANRLGTFQYTQTRTQERLRALLGSAHAVWATTTDPTLKVLGTFYESCRVADSLLRGSPPSATSTKAPLAVPKPEQCFHHTMASLPGALGELFTQELFAGDARLRMESLLNAIRRAILVRLERNSWMTLEEKTLALDRLQKLHLRVGMPTERRDWTPVVLSATDFQANQKTLANIANREWAQSIGEDTRERWKMSLATPNAMYSPREHAIEVPAVMFMPPFFEATGDDAVNFAGVGMVIGHEIFHSIASQLAYVENSAIKTQIEQFKSINSSLGTVDGWGTDGERTFREDIADLGGVLAAHDAWQATLSVNKTVPPPLIDGFTPEQRFFVALGRVWRGKWSGPVDVRDTHAAPFARVNAMVMQSPAFAKAFGCRDGDPMVLSGHKRASIW